MDQARKLALIERANEISLRGMGKTFPNPIVGAVIADEQGRVVSEGFHQGGPHAEVVALANFKGDPAEASLYLTLEPCNHHGKTGPCSEAIIKSGIKKVFYAVEDPNPIAEGGARRLREAGIEVEKVHSDRALFFNRDWLTKISLGRARMVWKVAHSLDGAIAAEDGTSKWITNEESRSDVKRVRDGVDAIITGTGTVLADNPTLNGKERNPVRVVVGERDLPSDFNIFDDSAETVHLKTRLIDEVLSFIKERGFNRVLVESGPKLGSSLFKAGLIDELLLYQAPSILGNGRRFTENLGISSIEDQIKLLDRGIEFFAQDLKRTLFTDNENNRRFVCSPV
ncbi:MAG: bifunctional diaminohydroxyphosphoribosylaminopyrimidine deaminase/5-amino-6-(5-phosphoribosylamino)uracil reductase RibD [Candidatus Nanopelagicaceae bacterium]